MNYAGHHSMMRGSGSASLPYQPLAGIYSDGTAYCVLPHVHTNATTGKVEFSVVSVGSVIWSNLQSKNFCGCSTNDSKHLLNNYNTGIGYPYTTVDMQLYCGVGIMGNAMAYPIVNPLTFIGERNGSNMFLTIKDKDTGTVLINKSDTTSVQMTLGRLGIFTQNDAGAGSGIRPIVGRVPENHAILSFKYWDGSDLIADLQPCQEIATGEICFFNLVDSSFVKNVAGSGSLSAYSQ